MKGYNIAVVGATGAVGELMIKILEERNFPVSSLKPLASKRSVGKKILFKGEELIVEETKTESFEGIDFALFAGTEGEKGASKIFAHEAIKRGAIVIDNGRDFRMNPNVPLIVPEVNPEDLDWHQRLIANPNCSTIQLVVVLKPIYDRVGIKRVVLTTFQSVSGAGRQAIEELRLQSEAFLKKEEIITNVFPYQIAFNLFPQIGDFLENDYTEEEMKKVNETRKIMHNQNLKISATCVRVPVFFAHSEVVNIETEEKISQEEVKKLLSNSSGIVVIDDPKENKYPMPIEVEGKDKVYVGRIREDLSCENGISLWIVADNLRKGAALNAVQIVELLIKR